MPPVLKSFLYTEKTCYKGPSISQFCLSLQVIASNFFLHYSCVQFYTFYKDFLVLGYQVSVCVYVLGISYGDVIDKSSMAGVHCTMEAVTKLQPVLSCLHIQWAVWR